MAYQVLSLKWRPKTFGDLVGQDHVTQTLVNAFKKDRVSQAYLFTGPRGVGKTTTARIVSKALNCKKSQVDPCNTCSNCTEITDGRNLDVLEIDAASNRGIDEIRNLREMIQYAPMNSPYKIYIIDEVHMLTTQAFNALLRTLEEPPKHGKFILATTDIHKVPATIISRCQRFDFNRITVQDIMHHVKHILQDEKISIDDESVKALAEKSEGSMRDALSILDQLIAYSGNKISFEDAAKVMGLIPIDSFFNLTTAMKGKDPKYIIQILNDIQMMGISAEQLTFGMNKHIRNLLLGSVTDALDIYDLTPDLKQKYEDVSKEWDRRDLLRIAELLTTLVSKITWATQPYILVEMTFLKLVEMDSSISLEKVLNEMSSPDLKIKPVSTPVSQPPVVYDLPQETTVEEDSKSEKKKESDKDTQSVFENDVKKSVIDQNDHQNSEDNNLSLEDVESKWGETIQFVSGNRPSLGSVMESCNLTNLHGKLLEISLSNQPSFNLNLLEKNKKLIEVQLKELLEKTIVIKFILDKSKNDAVLKTENNTIKTTGDTIENKDQTLLKIIERFDGEILK